MKIPFHSAAELLKILTDINPRQIINNIKPTPGEEWDEVARKKQMALSAREKDCPKRAFLGLCDAGLVKGINSGPYTASVNNKKYVLEAVQLLKNNPAFANIATTGKLWNQVLTSLGLSRKKHNQQMDVVLELWDKEFIQ